MSEAVFVDARRPASARIGNLNFADCERIRHSRDAAYDGVIYASAASAEAGGFRPCLRCRPETAPFSPAWNGTRATVGRA